MSKRTVVITAAILAVLTVALFHGITFPAGFLKPRLESVAAGFLKRDVAITGSVWITASLHPAIELNEISVADSAEPITSGRFLTLDKGYARINLLPLLGGYVQVEDLELQGADVSVRSGAVRPRGPDAEAASGDSGSAPGFAMDNMLLRDIHISYEDEEAGREYVLTVDEAHGQAARDKALHLNAEGDLLGQPYTLAITGDSLHDLISGAGTWALTNAEFTVADMSAYLSASVAKDAEWRAVDIDLSADARRLERIGELFGIAVPTMDSVSLKSSLGFNPEAFHLTGLEISALGSKLKGELTLSLLEKRPMLSGHLAVDMLDTRALVWNGSPKRAETGTGPLPWEMLTRLDSDLDLEVANIAAGAARDLKIGLSLRDGNLAVPFSVTVADAKVDGRIDAQAGVEVPAISAVLNSGAIELPHLAVLTEGPHQIDGTLGALSLRARTGGADLSTMWRDLDLSVQLGATRLETENEVLLAVNELSIERRTRDAYTLSTHGEFLAKPLGIQARLRPQDKNGSNQTLQLNIQACESHLQFDATAPPGKQASIDFSLSADGKKLCGLFESADAVLGSDWDFLVAADGHITEEGPSLKINDFRFGPVTADGEVKIYRDEAGKPRLSAMVHSDHLDFRPFLHQGERSTPPPHPVKSALQRDALKQEAAAQLGELLNHEFLPAKLDFRGNLAVKLYIDELEVGWAEAPSGLTLEMEVDEGRVTRAPFQMTFAGQVFRGDAHIDLTGEVPDMTVAITAGEFDLRKTLSAIPVPAAPDITADRLDLKLDLKGRSITELIKKGSLELNVGDGRWRVQRVFSEPLIVDVHTASFTRNPDEPARIVLDGFVDAKPLSGQVVADLFNRREGQPASVEVRAEMADTKFSLTGQIVKEGEKSVFHLNTSLSGDHMDVFDDVLGFRLPPLGPYGFNGAMTIDGGVVTFDDLELRVGESLLTGTILFGSTLNDEQKYDLPVPLRARFDAETIQLKDFQTGDWSALPEETGEPPKPEAVQEGVPEGQTPEEEVSEEREDEPGELNSLISPKLAEAVDASLLVTVKEVLSGRDKLGSGRLSVGIHDGTYSLDELRVDVPGGTVHIDGLIKPEADRTSAELVAQVDNLDYGVLVRRIEPSSEIKGEVQLNIDIHSEAPDPSRLKEYINGRVRIGVIPQELLAGVIDMWAVNVIIAALPVMTKGEESKINCLVADFTLEDGVMRPQEFVLDTSKIRVQGKGEVNFKTNKIDFYLKPTPKKPQFLSLATPVSVSGDLTDFHVGVTPLNVLGTVFKLATSVVVVPLQKLFSKKLDAEGADVCAAAMELVQVSE